MTEYLFDESTFIGGWYIPESICDNLIDLYYSNQTNAQAGTVGNERLDPEVKRSTELLISFSQSYLIGEYLDQLDNVLGKYKIKYPYSNSVWKYSILENTKIQHYKPTEGYYGWHAENDGRSEFNKSRHLVFMTYLNTVENAGTQFYHQKLTTPCRKGLTLIWPSAWTHTHRGVTNNEKDKFIITGWYNFEQLEN